MIEYTPPFGKYTWRDAHAVLLKRLAGSDRVHPQTLADPVVVTGGESRQQAIAKGRAAWKDTAR